ncbi:MAG: tetraacyldisaccharide 4'-kinase [Myxococcota bacterium]
MSFDPEHPPWPLLPLLWPASGLFGAGAWVREIAYKTGAKRAERLPVPVISVGNLTVGGNGKTPFVLELCARLERRPIRAVVVARALGQARQRAPVLAGQAGEALLSAEAVGDEARLLSQRSRLPVVVADEKRLAARYAAEALGAQAILVDDGFQHRALARDLDIVLLDAAAPYGNGRFLPAGSLREPRSALRRAGLVGLVQAPFDSARHPAAPRPDFVLAIQPRALRPLGGGPALELGALAGLRVAAAAAIGRPRRFLATLQGLGATIVSEALLRDHAPIPAATLEALAAQAEVTVITEKDAARFTGVPPQKIWVLEIGAAVVEGEAALEQALDQALAVAR